MSGRLSEWLVPPEDLHRLRRKRRSVPPVPSLLAALPPLLNPPVDAPPVSVVPTVLVPPVDAVPPAAVEPAVSPPTSVAPPVPVKPPVPVVPPESERIVAWFEPLQAPTRGNITTKPRWKTRNA